MSSPMTRGLLLLSILASLAGSWGCGGSSDSTRDDAGRVAAVADPEAAARAFRLFYRERVERAALATNRFAIFGDSVFATAIGRKAIARSGDSYEIVPGPTDNNLIGTSTLGAWQAYQVFASRSLELTLIRMLEGLVFYEAVTGVSGLTAREVLPGWTRVMDGRAGVVQRTRDGAPVVHPSPPDPALEAEMLATFYDGVTITYRENPADYYFSFKPVEELESYVLTYSFDDRPDFLRISNCCSSFKQTPPGNPWAGAWWGNHNSRDNFPDLALGILTALEVSQTPGLSPELTAAAQRALAAGRRIGDLVQASDGNLMTVDEFHAYGDLTVGGARRPHGDPENQDLGSMAACSMTYLARAIATAGLDLPVPTLPLPGAIEELLLGDLLGIDLDLPVADCTDLNQAYFGRTFAEQGRGDIFGLELFDLIRLLDRLSPGLADLVLGSFQNDFDDVVESTAAIVRYARATDRPELAAEALAALGTQTDLQRTFADILFARMAPERRATQRYDAALFDAVAGRAVDVADFGDFAIAEARIAAVEAPLALGDTQPWALIDDAEILERSEARVTGEKLDSIVDRYRATYGASPPVRRTAEGYEARTATDATWRAVETPRHRAFGGNHFLEELALCVEAPEILDCTWAKLGCVVADLDGSGEVDDLDASLQRSAAAAVGPGRSCGARNDWCEGADVDRTGAIDGLDAAFMAAAQGCRR